MEKSTCMDMYEGGDGRNTDIHEGRSRVAKLTLMETYEGRRSRASSDGVTFEVVKETTTVFCRVRRELENSVLPVGACNMVGHEMGFFKSRRYSNERNQTQRAHHKISGRGRRNWGWRLQITH